MSLTRALHRHPHPDRTASAETLRTREVARVYNRVARFYDVYDAPMDWLGGASRRQRVLSRAAGRVLEVGIGTGRNLAQYDPGVQLSGIDIADAMLARARDRAIKTAAPVTLLQGDVERLPFPCETFDAVTATCVFCSVPDPIAGLREVARVVRPNGQVLLLEHVRPRNAVLGFVFDLLSPITRRLFGPSINRRTEANVASAGLEIVELRRSGVWREIRAVPRPATDGRRP